MKKAHLTLTLSETDQPMVKAGTHVSPGDILVTSKPTQVNEFNLAKLLNVLPKAVEKYLVIKAGDTVEKGTVIARKKSLLKRDQVKAPIAGTFIAVDAEKGLYGIQEAVVRADVVSWFTGIVTEVSADKLVFELTGVAIPGKAGQGKPASGNLFYVDYEIDVFSMPTELAACVFCAKRLSSDIIAKADALGATALVAEEIAEPTFALPYVLVDDIQIVGKHHGRTTIVYGDEKQILVIEGKKA